MDVLVLSWDAAGGGGPSVRAAGLATALAAAGDDVRVVTRLAEGERPARLPGCEVHTVPDAAPVLPQGFGDDTIRSLGFAGPALAVASRRLRERPAVVTLALGGHAAEVALRLATTAGVVALELDDPDRAAGVATARPDAVLVAPTAPGVTAADRQATVPVVHVPAAGPRRRRPSRLPATAPVRLVPPPGERPRAAARALRLALASRGHRRGVTVVDRRRPVVTVVLAPDDADAVLGAAAAGTPVVARGGGRAAAAVGALGCGDVVDDLAGAVAACASLLADPAAAAARSRAGTTASATAREDAVGAVHALVDLTATHPPAVLRAVD